MRHRSLQPRPGLDEHADQVAARLRALADPVRLRLLALLARGDCPVGVLAAAVGVGQSLVSFHLAALRDAGLITTERVGRFTYVRLQLPAVAGLFGEVTDLITLDQPHRPGRGGGPMGTVVFACVHNAGRSQMAAAWFNQLAPPGLRAVSAGTRPADQVHPEVVQAMAEAGIDLARVRPKSLTDELAAEAALLVTMGCGEDCPTVAVPRQEWPVADPAGRPLDQVRAIRDELRERVVALLAELDDPAADQDLGAGERAVVHRVLRALQARFGPLLGAGRVERVVREEVRRLRGGQARVFLDVLVERHARERLRALAQAEGRLAKHIPELLFVCVRNAGRSQMAAALAEQAGHGRVHAWSAGSQPAGGVDPQVVRAMAELGIDLAANAPKPWTNELVRAADVVVTMGCGDDCPVFPGVRYLDWPVPDPAGRPLAEVRRIRDDLHHRVKDLLASAIGDEEAP